MSEPLKQALEQVVVRQTAQYFALLKDCECAYDEETIIKKKLRHAAFDGARVALRLRDHGVTRQDQIKRGDNNNG